MDQQIKAIEYPHAENAVLKEKLGKKCILLDNGQRLRLAAKSKVLGRKQLEHVGTVSPTQFVFELVSLLLRGVTILARCFLGIFQASLDLAPKLEMSLRSYF